MILKNDFIYKPRVINKEIYFWDIVNSFNTMKVVILEVGLDTENLQTGGKNHALLSMRL